ncbi:hypothetical protein HOY82DRAFT_340267 [Tuber indicum]|nr:hypothetical protein HOY82DRAFT_340267 [Tuber indicum]
MWGCAVLYDTVRYCTIRYGVGTGTARGYSVGTVFYSILILGFYYYYYYSYYFFVIFIFLFIFLRGGGIGRWILW